MKKIEVKVDHNFHPILNKKTVNWETSQSKDYHNYRQNWKEYPEKQIIKDFPIHLDIEATSRCNLLCVMCPRTEMLNEGTFWESKDFDFKLYKKIIDEGSQKGLCSIKLNILGEPLMNPKLIDMIKYAKDKGIVDVMFNTNACLLTESKSIQLIDSGLDKLFFSFDSAYRENYNKIRVNAEYTKVLDNIKKFSKIRLSKSSTSPFTRVSMVRCKENESEWVDFFNLFDSIVDSVAWVDYVEHSNKYSEKNSEESNNFCCPQLWQRMFIHPDGVATICCVDSARKLKVGNIFNNTIEEIWKNSYYNKIRYLHSSGNINKISICSNCHLAKL